MPLVCKSTPWISPIQRKAQRAASCVKQVCALHIHYTDARLLGYDHETRLKSYELFWQDKIRLTRQELCTLGLLIVSFTFQNSHQHTDVMKHQQYIRLIHIVWLIIAFYRHWARCTSGLMMMENCAAWNAWVFNCVYLHIWVTGRVSVTAVLSSVLESKLNWLVHAGVCLEE